MLLSNTTSGKYTVTKIETSSEIKSYLIGIGIMVGREIEIISNDNYYPIVVRIDNSRIALGRKIADKIYINATLAEN